MNWLDRIEPWAEPRRQILFDYIRVILGLFIIYKGVSFTQDLPHLQEMARNVNEVFAAFLSTYVTTVHMIGGTLLVLGLFTRWMCLLQIPILAGAVIFINFPRGFYAGSDRVELIVSIVVLVGLVFFFVMGSGKNSIDDIRRRDKERLDHLAD